MNEARDLRTKRQTMKRLLVLLTLAATAMVATTTAADAAVITNDEMPLAYAGFVPCANGGAGEVLSGTIQMHSLITSTVNNQNVSDHFQFQLHGSMVGAITGDTYRVTGVSRGMSKELTQNDAYALTYVNNFRLIGPGPGNDLLVHETAHLVLRGDDVVVEHDSLSIDCK
jgi:hypothetical protein